MGTVLGMKGTFSSFFSTLRSDFYLSSSGLVVSRFCFQPLSVPYFSLMGVLFEGLNLEIGKWLQVDSFVQLNNNNSSTSPDALEHNYLGDSARSFGLTLMSIALLLIALCALWVHRNRAHSVVIAAQPVFLYTLCLGLFLMCLDILVSSFDKNQNGVEETTMHSLCYVSVWVASLGHMISYCSLYTKVSRCSCAQTSFQFT